MRMIGVGALLGLAMMAAAPAFAQAQYFDVTQVADGVYAAIGKNGAFCNAAVLINKDDVLVVDTHLRPLWAHDLIGQIKRTTDKPVRYVVDTHWHPDHVQGSQAYVNVFGPTVEYLAQHNTREDIIHKAIPSIQDSLRDVPEAIAKMEKTLADGKDADGKPLTDEARAGLTKQTADQKEYLEELRHMQIALPTITFDRSLYLHKPGDRTIQVLYFGKGHTRGDVVVYLPKEKVVATGDLLTNGIPFMRDAYPVEWVTTLEAIQGLDWDVAIPGHGDVQHGKKQIARLIAFMSDVVAQVKSAVAQGMSLEETKKTVNLASHAADFPVYKTPAAWQRAADSAVERCWMEVAGKVTD